MTFLTLLAIGVVLFVVQGLYRNRGGKFDGVPSHLDSVVTGKLCECGAHPEDWQ